MVSDRYESQTVPRLIDYEPALAPNHNKLEHARRKRRKKFGLN